MGPEAPYLAAGAVAIAGGVAREKAWPKEGTVAILGTFALVIVASATTNTRIAPLVRALGFLFLLTAVMAAVPEFQAARTRKAKK